MHGQRLRLANQELPATSLAMKSAALVESSGVVMVEFVVVVLAG